MLRPHLFLPGPAPSAPIKAPRPPPNMPRPHTSLQVPPLSEQQWGAGLMAAREGLVGGLSWGGGSPTPVALETAGSWRELGGERVEGEKGAEPSSAGNAGKPQAQGSSRVAPHLSAPASVPLLCLLFLLLRSPWHAAATEFPSKVTSPLLPATPLCGKVPGPCRGGANAGGRGRRAVPSGVGCGRGARSWKTRSDVLQQTPAGLCARVHGGGGAHRGALGPSPFLAPPGLLRHLRARARRCVPGPGVESVPVCPGRRELVGLTVLG